MKLKRFMLSLLMVSVIIMSFTLVDGQVCAASKPTKVKIVSFGQSESMHPDRTYTVTARWKAAKNAKKYRVRIRENGETVYAGTVGKRIKEVAYDKAIIDHRYTVSVQSINGKKKAAATTATITVVCRNHNYERQVITPATKDTAGKVQYVCTYCGKVRDNNAEVLYYQPTEEQAYQDIIAMKSGYPEGRRWTNDNFYEWSAGVYSGGYGCAGFAMAMSDAAFGKYPPARKHTDLSQLKVGDILRVNHDTHSVIVLQINGDTITIAEGNYNSSVHWGRTLSRSSLQGDSEIYILTRWQED